MSLKKPAKDQPGSPIQAHSRAKRVHREAAEVAEDENKLIGEIKLDAMFSPVVKATYKVENSRVGQVTDFDKLVLQFLKTVCVLGPKLSV